MTAALADLYAAITRWRVWLLMGNQDIYIRYRRSLLGPFWISLALAAMILGLGLLYSQILHQDFREFLSYLASGLLCWYFLSALLVEGGNSVIEAEGNLRAVSIPLPVLAVRMAYRNLIIFLHNLVVVVIFLLITHKMGVATLPVAMLGLLLYLLFGVGVALVLGPISARFRDIPQLIASIIQILFFITPIIWVPSQLVHNHPVVSWNPFYHLIQLVRAPLLGSLPAMQDWTISLVTVLLVCLGGFVSLMLTRRKVFTWL